MRYAVSGHVVSADRGDVARQAGRFRSRSLDVSANPVFPATMLCALMSQAAFTQNDRGFV